MTTATTMTDDERHAGAFAIADDLAGVAKDLRTACVDLMHAPVAETTMHAREILSYSRMIANLMAPLDAIVNPTAGEVT